MNNKYLFSNFSIVESKTEEEIKSTQSSNNNQITLKAKSIATFDSAHSGKTIVRGTAKTKKKVIKLKKNKYKLEDKQLQMEISSKSYIHLKKHAKNKDSTKDTLKLPGGSSFGGEGLKGEKSFAKLLELSIHNNLLRHQNWMYKECMERVAKSNRFYEQIVYGDMKEKLKKLYSLEQSQHKMKRLFSYYGKRPPVRPSYCNLKQQKLMTDYVKRQRIMFKMKSKSRSFKSSSHQSTSSMGSKTSPGIDNMLFTSSFYKNLDNEDNDLTGSIQKDYRSSHCSISRRSIQSSFSKTLKKKKSYKLDDLLQNESLISRKNENKVVKSKVRISRDITSGTPDFNKTEFDKIKDMKEMIKKHTKSKRNKKLVVPSVKDMTLSQRRRSSMTIQDIINKARENSSFNRTMTGNLQQTTLKAKPLKKRTKLVLQGQSSNYSVTRSHSNIQTVFHGQGVDHSHTNSMMSLGIPMNSNPSKIGDSARVLMSANNSGRGDSKSIPQLSALPPKTPVHVVGKHQRHKTSFTSNNSSFNYKTEHQRDLEESKALPKSSFRRKTSFVDIFNQRLKKFKHGRDNSVSQGDHTLGKDLSETLPKLKMNPSSLANLNTLKVLKRKKKDP